MRLLWLHHGSWSTNVLKSFYESHGTRAYPPVETCLVGLCLGSLAAAAVASSHSLTDLLPLASETVGIAFRIGLHTLEKGRLLHRPSKGAKPWSVVFGGLDELAAKTALEDFNRELVRIDHSTVRQPVMAKSDQSRTSLFPAVLMSVLSALIP